MNLPDFLVIGARKSGTTWLYNVLKSHSEIRMAINRKEVHFFDRYYERGVEWYKDKFPDDSKKIIGEVTPDYLSEKECVFRIKKIVPEIKLICILRDPIKRAYSAYKYLVQEKNYKGNFEKAIKDNENILKRGLYYKQLNRYFDAFTQENIKIIIFEQALSDKEDVIEEICDFLGVSNSFNVDELYNKSNPSKIPRFNFLYALSKRFVRKLYDWDLVFIVNLMKKIGLKNLFFSDQETKQFSPMTDKIKIELKQYYQDDINKLEDLIDQDLKRIWNFN